MLKKWKRQAMSAAYKIDYGAYRLSAWEMLQALFLALAVTALFAYVFYRSYWGMLVYPAAAILCMKKERLRRQKLQQQRLSAQFTDTLLSVTASLQTGHSAENAFLEAEREIASLHGTSCEMAEELALIRKGLRNHMPLEQLLCDLGRRSRVEEIQDFTEVFAAAKRSGGNLREMIRRTAALTQQRLEVERDIAELLTARQFELKVMNLIPFFLIGYIQLSSRGFFDMLYHNAAGIAVMTVCLLLYLTSCALSAKIMDIRV